MESTVTIDLRHVARGLDFSLRQVQATVELLDEGNTVPFITRYRKDQTGGLDEEQIREIQARLTKLRQLADRKQTILRSIESQGKLTEKLSKQILAATTAKRLEDLYLPFKPKKTSLATLARSRGLEPLAREILDAAPACADLDARAADFVSAERQVPTAADALLGAGHILAEWICENAELRGRLREVLHRSGVLACSPLVHEDKAGTKPSAASGAKAAAFHAAAIAFSTIPPATPEAADSFSRDTLDDAANADSLEQGFQPVPRDQPFLPGMETSSPINGEAAATQDRHACQAQADMQDCLSSSMDVGSFASGEIVAQAVAGADFPAGAPSSAERRKLARLRAKQEMQAKREQIRKKLEEDRIKEFRDYFDYREALKKIPPHRILAINRGERAKVLRVRIESDQAAMHAVLDEMLVPPDHPHADYLRGCARDTLARLILPSLEREARREMTDFAESHAVGVFARNLRNLLLQPPVHGHRLLAVDPGFRSGCKLAALDEFGNLLDSGVIYLVGKPDRSAEARQTVLDLIEKHRLTAAAIGNGTACRHAENFFSDLLEKELKDKGFAYVIVNEAGASVYSTSRIGREEFPDCDATLRGAISIGRRLLDPLSELVKIDPANIGVGLYQHDVKAKHLRASLDEVVESCVNFVGVDANTASPALLRYVSGLNQLTARRLYEHRRERGPFRTREQLREVPGFGEATFIQAAGFLKINGGDNPLDATWIHPESYAAAAGVLERLQASPADLRDKESAAALADRIAKVDRAALAAELGVGLLTLNDILAQLVRPGRDPREDLPAPVFKRGVLKLEDLSPGMELTGTVLNVVDFGCFVDIGMHDSGLVHVSRMADRFVRDPHDVAAVGDIVKVWVVGIDKERRRVSLTMIRPGSDHAPRTPDRTPHAPREGTPRAPREGEPTPGGRPPRPRQKGPRQGGRPPRGSGEPIRGRPPRHGGHHGPPRPAPKPKPLIPITEAMKAGKEPLRTFGDLMQFYQHKASTPATGQSAPAAAPAEPPLQIANAPPNDGESSEPKSDG